MKKAIDIPNAPKPVGSYSQAILNNNTLYISGQIPLNPVTQELELNSIQKATEQVMSNIQALLNAAGMTTANVIKCSIFLKDMDDFSKVNGNMLLLFLWDLSCTRNSSSCPTTA